MPTLEDYAHKFLEPYIERVEDRGRQIVRISDDVISVPLFLKPRLELYYEDEETPTETSEGVVIVGTLYIGTSGLQLLAIANESRKKENEQLLVFVEINHEIKKDSLSKAFFDIIPQGKITAESGQLFLDLFHWIEGPFQRSLNLQRRKEFSDLVRAILNPETTLLDDTGRAFLTGVELFFSAAILGIEILNPIIIKCTVDETVWNRKKRSKNWKNVFEGAAKELDSLHDKIPDFKALAKIDMGVLSDSLDKLNQIGAGIKELIDSMRQFIRKHLVELKDSADTLIGFFSGFWNGLVDTVSGLLSLLLLVMKLANSQLAQTKDVDKLRSVFTEAIDETVQAFANIEWRKVWNHIKDKKVPEIIQFIEEEYEAIAAHVEDVSVLGYWLGYFIFSVIENLFPPLKLTKATKIASAGVPVPTPVAQALKGL